MVESKRKRNKRGAVGSVIACFVTFLPDASLFCEGFLCSSDSIILSGGRPFKAIHCVRPSEGNSDSMGHITERYV